MINYDLSGQSVVTFEFQHSNMSTNSQVNRKYVIENNVIRNTEDLFKHPINDIGRVIIDAFDQNPNLIGQIDAMSGERRTFAEMKDRTLRCAAWLKREGLQEGDVLSMVSGLRLDDFVPCLAAFYTGVVYNPWVDVITIDAAMEFLKSVTPKIIIVCSNEVPIILQAVQRLNFKTKIVTFEKHSGFDWWEECLAEATEREIEILSPFDVSKKKQQGAVILFSSGTTGAPKSVELPYGTIMIHLQKSLWYIPENCVALWYSAPSWVTGMYFTLLMIVNHGTRIIHNKFDVEETCKCIEKYKVNWLFATPTHLAYLCKANISERYPLSSLKRIITGGSTSSYSIRKKLKADFPHISTHDVYGITEFGGTIALEESPLSTENSVGSITASVQLKVLDVKTGNLLGPNEKGELLIKKPYMMNGYYRNPELTNKIIDKEGWYHTGDVGYYNTKGELFLTGRIKDVIISQNYHVPPMEIENILLNNPAVTEAAVVGIPHEADVERPVAFVATAPGTKVTKEDLFKLLNTGEIYAQYVKNIVFVNEMPRTANGKVVKSILKKKYMDGVIGNGEICDPTC